MIQQAQLRKNDTKFEVPKKVEELTRKKIEKLKKQIETLKSFESFLVASKSTKNLESFG